MYKHLLTTTTDEKTKAQYHAKITELYDQAISCYKNKAISLKVDTEEALNQKIGYLYGRKAYDMFYTINSPYADKDVYKRQAIQLMREFRNEPPTFAILKHTNPCGIATRTTVLDAWNAALAGDPVSAFGGILISNHTIDADAAKEIDKIFYEVLIAPDFTEDAKDLLMAKPCLLYTSRCV